MVVHVEPCLQASGSDGLLQGPVGPFRLPIGLGSPIGLGRYGLVNLCVMPLETNSVVKSLAR